jgi:hypothetical protein
MAVKCLNNSVNVIEQQAVTKEGVVTMKTSFETELKALKGLLG